MSYLLAIVLTLALLVGFIVLTHYETRQGVRLYEARRARWDSTVERIEFVLEHVNLFAFLREELRHLASRVGHDIAHLTLLVVRAVERLLTRLVRRLRTSPEIDTGQRETAREFVKTLSDFKNNLGATRPEISDIT